MNPRMQRQGMIGQQLSQGAPQGGMMGGGEKKKGKSKVEQLTDPRHHLRLAKGLMGGLF